jgi:hypothetical protein
MGRTGVERRFVDEAAAQVAVTASDLVASREPAQLIRRFVMLPPTAAIMRDFYGRSRRVRANDLSETVKLVVLLGRG